MFFQATVREHQLNDFAQRVACRLLAHHVKFGNKRADVGARLAAHGAYRIMQRATRGPGNVLQLFNTARANAARRKVHHTHEAGVVVRVLQQTQIGQCVFDLGAFKKPQTAVHAVRQAGVKQRGFHDPALCVAAVQQRNFFARGSVTHQLLDLVNKPLRLGKITR